MVGALLCRSSQGSGLSTGESGTIWTLRGKGALDARQACEDGGEP